MATRQYLCESKGVFFVLTGVQMSEVEISLNFSVHTGYLGVQGSMLLY